jgi:hypothetical protein
MKKIIFFIFISLILKTNLVLASSLSVVVPKTIETQKQFEVKVNLDTGGVSINSFDISISYPKEILKFEGYKEEGSINKSWYIAPTEKEGSINFIGIIPGGVDGVYDPDKNGLQAIPITKLLFSPISSGLGEFKIINSSILENNGLGTPLVYDAVNSSISVSINDFKNIEEKEDIEPPLPFEITFIESGFFSKTPSMIIFSTTDKESGIKSYQVKKTSEIWKDVVSPLAVSKSLLKKDIIVRAVDFNGNIRVASIQIPGLMSGNQLFLYSFILILICVFWHIRKKKK